MTSLFLASLLMGATKGSTNVQRWGLNWKNIGPRNSVSQEFIQVEGIYNNRVHNPRMVSVEQFERPLAVSVEMRLAPGERQECLGLQVFPQDSCMSHACGYVSGLGWWGNKFGVVTNVDAHSHAPYGGAIEDQYVWHTVKMTFPKDGKNQYWFDGKLMATVQDNRRSKGNLRFMGCATGQFRNLKVTSANKCTCPNGSPQTGAGCTKNGATMCKSCKVGWALNSDKSACDANVCSCTNGSPQTGAGCTKNGAAMCKSCKVGWTLNSDKTACTKPVTFRSEGGWCHTANNRDGPRVWSPNKEPSHEECKQGCVDRPWCIAYSFKTDGTSHERCRIFAASDSVRQATGMFSSHCGDPKEGPVNHGNDPNWKTNTCFFAEGRPNVCSCTNGSPQTGAGCTKNGAAMCKSCKVGWTLNSDKTACTKPTTTITVNTTTTITVNTCTCTNGSPQTGADCTKNGAAMCKSCNVGWMLSTENGAAICKRCNTWTFLLKSLLTAKNSKKTISTDFDVVISGSMHMDIKPRRNLRGRH